MAYRSGIFAPTFSAQVSENAQYVVTIPRLKQTDLFIDCLQSIANIPRHG